MLDFFGGTFFLIFHPTNQDIIHNHQQATTLGVENSQQSPRDSRSFGSTLKGPQGPLSTPLKFNSEFTTWKNGDWKKQLSYWGPVTFQGWAVKLQGGTF